MDHLNVTRVGQLYVGSHLYEDVQLVEQFIPSRILTFQVNGKFHSFEDYTSTHADTNICSLFPHLAPLHTHLDPLNYQSFVNLFPSSKLGIKDVNSVLQTLSEADLMHHQLTKLFETNPAFAASTDLFTLLDSTTFYIE